MHRFAWWQWSAALAGSAMISYVVVGDWMFAAAFAAATLACVAMAVRAQAKEITAHVAVPVVEFVMNNVHDRIGGESVAYVHNIGGSTARNVDIRAVQVARGTVTFRSIPVLKPGDRVPLPVDRVSDYRGRLDIGSFFELFDLPKEWWLAWLAKGEGELTFPLVIHFRDSLWRTRTERQTVTVDRDGRIITRSKSPRA